VEKRLLVTDGVVVRKAVARAECWLENFLSRCLGSLTAIAAYERVTKRYVSRLIRLGLLAQEIIDGIAEGSQALELTAQARLTRTTELPLGWWVQRKGLGQLVQLD
jgi:hypothetical protein